MTRAVTSPVEARRRVGLARFWRQYRRSRSGLLGLGILTFFVLLALAAPLLVNEEALKVTYAGNGPSLAPPSTAFPFGTDESGRSILTLVVWGSRLSLVVGLLATVLSMVIGTVVGVASGHFPGPGGGLLNKLIDWFLVIPFLPFAIVVATALGRVADSWPGGRLLVLIIVIGILSFMTRLATRNRI